MIIASATSGVWWFVTASAMGVGTSLAANFLKPWLDRIGSTISMRSRQRILAAAQRRAALITQLRENPTQQLLYSAAINTAMLYTLLWVSMFGGAVFVVWTLVHMIYGQLIAVIAAVVLMSVIVLGMISEIAEINGRREILFEAGAPQVDTATGSSSTADPNAHLSSSEIQQDQATQTAGG